MAFTRPWDNAIPADTQAANLLGQNIRRDKEDTAERIRAFGAGKIANRETPEADFGNANIGVIFWAEDEGKVYRWNGTTWVLVATVDPLTTKGDIIVNDGTSSIRLPIGANDQVLTADSGEANGLKWAAAGGISYALQGFAANHTAPADSTTFFFGAMAGQGPLVIASRSRLYIPAAGNITLFRLFAHISGTLGSAEIVNFWVRLNDTTDSLNVQLSLNAVAVTGSAAGSVAVVAGDFIEFKYTSPVWVTNPTNIRFAAVVLVQ